MNLSLIISIALGIFLLLLFLKLIFARVGKQLENRVRLRYPGRNYVMISIGANFFGQESSGHKQVRGNGALVLTESELWFTLAIPKREIAIPISSVSNISLVSSFLGKSIFKPLLCVEFENHGSPDAIAWALKNPEAWIDKIQSMMKAVAQ